MFRYETHCHTIYTSACSHLDAKTIVHLYKSNGYDGIVVTDHFLNGNTTVDRALSWNDQIDEFFRGYEQVEMEGRKAGLKVFFGLEYSYLGTDFLTYGLDRHWLKSHDGLLKLSVREYLALVRKDGALAVQAHPYREADYIDHIRLYPSDVDGIETVNAGRSPLCNRLGDFLAQEYGLLKTGGSDLHMASQPLLSGVETEEEVYDLAGLINCIRARKAVPFLMKNQYK